MKCIPAYWRNSIILIDAWRSIFELFEQWKMLMFRLANTTFIAVLQDHVVIVINVAVGIHGSRLGKAPPSALGVLDHGAVGVDLAPRQTGLPGRLFAHGCGLEVVVVPVDDAVRCHCKRTMSNEVDRKSRFFPRLYNSPFFRAIYQPVRPFQFRDDRINQF